MQIIIMIIIQIAIAYAMAVIAARNASKRVEAGRIDANTLTQATENKAFTLVFGTVESPGNLVWYGGFSTFDIKDKINAGMGITTTQTVAVGYRLSMMVAFGCGDMQLIAVKSGKQTVFENNIKGQFSKFVDEKHFYGDYKKQGGLQGNVTFYEGNATQLCNQDLKNLLAVDSDKLVEYRNLSYIYFSNFYLGNSANPAMFSYVLRRIPQFSFLPEEKSMINGGCNPVNAICSLLTDELAGAGLSESSVDLQSFIDVQDKLYKENVGLNYVFEDAINVDDVIKKINDVTDSNIILNRITPTNPKLKLTLNRNDYSLDDVIVFDESNIISFDKKTTNSDKTVMNQLVISFKDVQDNFSIRTATFQNEANSNQSGTIRSMSMSYNEIGDMQLAQSVLYRKAMAITQQISLISMTVNRVAENLEIGDVILVKLDKYKLDGVPYRIQEIDFGSATKNEMKINAVEDTQKTKEYIYSDATGKWQDTNFKAINAESLFLEAPYNLTTISDEEINSDNSQFLIAVKKPNGVHRNFQVFENTDAVTDISNFTPILKTASRTYQQDDFINLLEDSNYQDIYNNVEYLNDVQLKSGVYANLIMLKNEDKVEFCSFSHIQDKKLMNVKRALFDTIPTEFSSSTNVYFLFLDSQITRTSFNKNQSNQLKVITMTTKDTLPFDQAGINVVKTEATTKLPINVSNLKISFNDSFVNIFDGSEFILDDQDVNFSYSFRDKIRDVQFYNDVNEVNNDQNIVKMKIKNNGLVIAEKESSINNIIFTNDEEKLLNSGVLFSELDIEIYTEKNTLISNYIYSVKIVRS